MADIVVKQTDSGSTIQEMSATDKNYIEHVLLSDFYAAGDTGTGTVSINPADTTGLTNIGSIVDTKVGDAPGTAVPGGTTITTVTYVFYQDLQTVSESVTAATRPLMIDSTTNLQRMGATKVDADFLASTQSNLVNSGIGMYKLQSSAPTDGTWVAKGTITNELQTGTNTTYKLWRKSAAASAPTTVRPVKFSSGTMQELTDTEIKQFTARLKNKIKAGVGQYKVSASAPTSGGTWAIAGTAFLDTRFALANQDYARTYTGTYTNTFSNTFTGFFAGSRQRFSPYTGASLGTFNGNYSNTFTGFFTGTFTGNYVGTTAKLTVQNTQETISTYYLWVRTA
jgi:hypothetical protein